MRSVWCAVAGFTFVLTCLAAQTAAQSTPRLERFSADAAGGGRAENPRFRVLVAVGQHDAGVTSASGAGQRFRYAGGVFARISDDGLFADGFEEP